jgi:hypothetical protein
MAKLSPAARAGVIAGVFALVVAAPAAAAQPTRTVYPVHPPQGVFATAGTACPFDVGAQPSTATLRNGFTAETDFSDGRLMFSVHRHGAYVNLETGASFPTNESFTEIDRFDPATGILYGEDLGQPSSTFNPGDIGPYGVVGTGGAFYHFNGTLSFTYDTNTNVFSVVAYSGRVTDICAALS